MAAEDQKEIFFPDHHDDDTSTRLLAEGNTMSILTHIALWPSDIYKGTKRKMLDKYIRNSFFLTDLYIILSDRSIITNKVRKIVANLHFPQDFSIHDPFIAGGVLELNWPVVLSDYVSFNNEMKVRHLLNTIHETVSWSHDYFNWSGIDIDIITRKIVALDFINKGYLYSDKKWYCINRDMYAKLGINFNIDTFELFIDIYSRDGEFLHYFPVYSIPPKDGPMHNHKYELKWSKNSKAIMVIELKSRTKTKIDVSSLSRAK